MHANQAGEFAAVGLVEADDEVSGGLGEGRALGTTTRTGFRERILVKANK